MAEELPHPDRLRVLLTDPKIGAEELLCYGDRFFEAGRPNVAVMFFERARSKEGLDKIKAAAVKDGDEFLLSAVAKAEPSLVAVDDWRACAESALTRGRFAFARDAFRKAGDEERSGQAHQKYLQIFSA
jgi:hypothetical protein